MGCGGSVAEKAQLKVQVPQDNLKVTQKEVPKPQNSQPYASNKTVDKNNANLQKTPVVQKKQQLTKSIGKNDLEKNSKGKSPSNLRSSDSGLGKYNDLSSSKLKQQLRQSSLSKSQRSSKDKHLSTSKTKFNLTGSKTKQGNPEDQPLSNSVIKEESQLRNTKTKKETHSIKKIKSVKNNKELADLIKIYAL